MVALAGGVPQVVIPLFAADQRLAADTEGWRQGIWRGGGVESRGVPLSSAASGKARES